MLSHIKSFIHLQNMYPTQEQCIELLEKILWEGNPVSPFDADSKVYKYKNGRYRCANTKKYFNILKNTCFEGTKLPLATWFYAVWKITTTGSGITSTELAFDMGITQKTAWFLLHRIRACASVENEAVLSGVVECDETFIGGKNGNRHKSRKIDYSTGTTEKIPVLGMLQRNGKMTVKVMPNRQKESIQPLVVKYVANGSQLITDECPSYNGLAGIYNHRNINHSAYEYVSLEDTSLHNNNVESAWRVLKRSVSGRYVSVAPKHLQSYVDEFAYRYNTRELTTSDKFYWLIANPRKRTRYIDLKARQFDYSPAPVKTYKGTGIGRPIAPPNFKKLN